MMDRISWLDERVGMGLQPYVILLFDVHIRYFTDRGEFQPQATTEIIFWPVRILLNPEAIQIFPLTPSPKKIKKLYVYFYASS